MATRRAKAPAPPAPPRRWPPGEVLAVGTRIVLIGREVVEITGHLTLDAKTGVHRPVTSSAEPVAAYQVQTRGGSERIPLVEGWGCRPLASPDDAARALALLRASSVPAPQDLVAPGLPNEHGQILRPTTLLESAALLRARYARPPDAWDVASSMRAHGDEREVLGEIAHVLGGTFDALRDEMRQTHPSLASWERGRENRQATGSKVLDALKARKKKPKSTPLP
ncbi:MAG: hypothetical protein U0325_06085 [Polyangiales bacterium]